MISAHRVSNSEALSLLMFAVYKFLATLRIPPVPILSQRQKNLCAIRLEHTERLRSDRNHDRYPIETLGQSPSGLVFPRSQTLRLIPTHRWVAAPEPCTILDE